MKCKEVVLQVNNISKKINSHLILDDICFSLYRGQICSIVGKNGSGKSMLFKAICGLIRPSKGQIEVFGKIVGMNGRCAIRTGALIESPGLLPEYSCFKNLKILSEINNTASEQDIKDALIKVGLDPSDKRPVRKYSLGMRQKLGIAQAIFEKPELLVLDEPTNNIDIESIKEIQKLLKDLNQKDNITILLASHQKADIDILSKRVITIDNGKITSDLEVIEK